VPAKFADQRLGLGINLQRFAGMGVFPGTCQLRTDAMSSQASCNRLFPAAREEAADKDTSNATTKSEIPTKNT